MLPSNHVAIEPNTAINKEGSWCAMESLCSDDTHLAYVQLETCDSSAGKLGVTVCYDLRFPEMYQLLAWHLGAQIILVPSAFTVATGVCNLHDYTCVMGLSFTYAQLLCQSTLACDMLYVRLSPKAHARTAY